jgi:hypothetical protein
MHRESADSIAANYPRESPVWKKMITDFEASPETAKDPYEEPDMGLSLVITRAA